MESKTPMHIWPPPPPPRNQPVTFIHSSTTEQKLKQLWKYKDKHNEREARRREKKKAAAEAVSSGACQSTIQTSLPVAGQSSHEPQKNLGDAESQVIMKYRVIVCTRCKGQRDVPIDESLDEYLSFCEMRAD